MLNNFSRAFVLAPHTDDGELGAGGTINKLIMYGCEVYYFAFSTAEKSVPDGYPKDILKTELLKATSAIGIKEKNVIVFDYEVRKLNYFRQEILENLIAHKNNLSPDLIFIPSLNDVHQDHSTIAHEGLRAFKNSTILGYELIWNNLNFNTCCYVELNESNLDCKIKAIGNYNSQSNRQYMSPEFIRSHAITRGVQFGVDFAESFEVLRWKLI